VVVVWLSSNTFVLINVVTLCWARLVPGWVTILGSVNDLGVETSHLGQLSLSHSSVGRCSEYQQKLGSKQAHNVVQVACIRGLAVLAGVWLTEG